MGSVLYGAWSAAFSSVAIFLLLFVESKTGFELLIASFGASAVLIFDEVSSPLAQPKNVIVGHMLSASIGVACRACAMSIASRPSSEGLHAAGALAVGLSIWAMRVGRVVHPPGGATALIAVLGPPVLMDMGFWYVLYPVGVGACALVLMAVAFNAIPSNGERAYPRAAEGAEEEGPRRCPLPLLLSPSCRWRGCVVEESHPERGVGTSSRPNSTPPLGQ